MIDVHTLFEFAGANAHECHAVAVRLVHVCLNLEYESGKMLVKRINDFALGHARGRRRSHLQEVLQKRLNAEVGQCGTEEYRRQRAGVYAVHVKFLTGAAEQLDVILQGLPKTFADHRLQLRIVRLVNGNLGFLGAGDGSSLKRHDMVFLAVIDALEFLAAADWPVNGIGVNAQLLFQLVEQVIRVAGLQVHLVDKSENRDTAHGADLEQLAGLCLDALGCVDNHDCGVRSHQGAVGVLREVLMTRGIQNVDAVSAVFKLKHRGRDRDAALLLNFHPVGNGMTRILLALYGTGELNCSAVQQEFLCNGRFAGIRMRNNRKRAALCDF